MARKKQPTIVTALRASDGKKPHLPVGARVALIRTRRGWHDGGILGEIIQHVGGVYGTAIIKEDEGGYIHECDYRRDYYV